MKSTAQAATLYGHEARAPKAVQRIERCRGVADRASQVLSTLGVVDPAQEWARASVLVAAPKIKALIGTCPHRLLLSSRATQTYRR